MIVLNQLSILILSTIDLFSSLDDIFKSLITSFGSLINTDAHAIKYREILELILPSNLLSETEIEAINERVDQNMDWQNNYYGTIESWLNGEESTESSTEDGTSSTASQPDESSTIETTTQGAGSLIASLAIVVGCASIKLFI